MNYYQALEYINSFSHSGKKVEDLSRISHLLELLDNPQEKLRFIHIAGTNGKGSVLEYCSNAFINSGIKTGQFTSPYVFTYCDRIRINGKNIPEDKVAEICSKIKNKINSDFYSQFEINFAIALIYFLEEKCDIVFLETGIGGTLDATNIIHSPLASIITSISIDHTAILGNTIEEIASHKLGIIKENCPSFISCNNDEKILLLAKLKANEKNSRLIIPYRDKCIIKKMDINGSEFIYKNKNYKVKMCGEHQIINSLTAIEALEHLKIKYENIYKSLSETLVASRIEVIDKDVKIIIDGGHNTSGIDSIVNTLKKSGINNIVGIFGMVKGKPIDYAVKNFSNLFKKVYCVDGFIENAVSSEITAEKFKKFNVETEICNINEACNKAYTYAKNKNLTILACGSLYLASNIKKYFNSL